MIRSLTALLSLTALAVAVLGYWAVTYRAHRRRMAQLEVCVHVNGIRGKSSVTRLLSGALREAGYVTLGKTTGSAARLLHPTGREEPLRRLGSPTINEQMDVVERDMGSDVDALVIECMAVRPLYQKISQERIVQSEITVLTNVRLDHQEEMGETLEEITDSLALTTPYDGVLVTAEADDALCARLEAVCRDRGSRLLRADPSIVTDAHMSRFGHLEHRDNVAAVLAVADYLGVPREVALRGMWEAAPDPGAINISRRRVGDADVVWAPLFAVNDEESTVATLDLVRAAVEEDVAVVALLNNRTDRGRRAELFADMLSSDDLLRSRVDHVVLIGAFEQLVGDLLRDGGWAEDDLTLAGEHRGISAHDLLQRLHRAVGGRRLLLVGLCNIHTSQAHQLRALFEEDVDGIRHSPPPSAMRHLLAARTHRDAVGTGA